MRLDDGSGKSVVPAQNGSVIVFRDEVTMQKAAKLMGRKGPGDVDVTSAHKFTFNRPDGSTFQAFWLHYDNVKRDDQNQHLLPTPAELFEASVPAVSVVTNSAGGAEVKQVIKAFLISRSQEMA